MNASPAQARKSVPSRPKTAARADGAALDKNAAMRQKLIRLIHVAKRELQMDEPTYRTMLLSAGRAESTSDMDVPALKAVLDQAKRVGFKVRAKAGAATAPRQDRRQDTAREAVKVRALWLFLHHLGVVRDPSEQALATYVKRIAKVDDMHWAHGDRMLALIETLKKWAMRFLPGKVRDLMAEVVEANQRAPLMPDQAEAANKAHVRLMAGEGYDVYWDAWELLHVALGRPLPADVKGAQ